VVVKKKSRIDPKLWSYRIIQGLMKGVSTELITTCTELVIAVTYGP